MSLEATSVLPSWNPDYIQNVESNHERIPKAEKWRRKTGELLESQRVHKAVIFLILIDATFAIIDLGYTFLSPSCGGFDPDNPETDVELPVWLEVLAHISLAITTLFLIEIPLAIWAFTWRYYNPFSDAYPHAGFHLLDAFVIIGSFVVEVFLKGKERELASLLIILRLWRIIKLVGGVAVGVGELNEAAAKELLEAQKEIAQLRERIQELESKNTPRNEL
ncbi:hypothetical protein FRC03_005293 [Tulasnella sp. 419]|nr:hypothetical protein FRC03_005293 [Tulasnella sp. 419]